MLVKKKAYCLNELDGDLSSAIKRCSEHFVNLVENRIFLSKDYVGGNDRKLFTDVGIPISFDTSCIKFETVIEQGKIKVDNFSKVNTYNEKCKQDAHGDAYCDFENHISNILYDFKDNPDGVLFFKIITLGNKDYYFYTI